MLHKTNGIVLKVIKYSESSIITNIFTEKFGLQTYIVNGVRSAKAKGKAGLYVHGNILDLVVYYRESGNIFRISEAKVFCIYKTIPFDIIKSSLLLFCIEVLNKTLKENTANEMVYNFLQEAFIFLDATQKPVNNFHIIFLIELSKHIGFYPSHDTGKYFDMQEGIFTNSLPKHAHYLEEKNADVLKKFLNAEITQAHCINISGGERKALLFTLITYYKLHVEGFSDMHSPAILSEVMSYNATTKSP